MKIDWTLSWQEIRRKTSVLVIVLLIIIIASMIYSNSVAEKRSTCVINCGDYDDCIRQCDAKGLKGSEYGSCLRECSLKERICLEQCK